MLLFDTPAHRGNLTTEETERRLCIRINYESNHKHSYV